MIRKSERGREREVKRLVKCIAPMATTTDRSTTAAAVNWSCDLEEQQLLFLLLLMLQFVA